MSAADHIQAAAEAVDEAVDHHANAMDAAAQGDTRKMAVEHAHVSRCLRQAKSAFRSLAAEAAEQDSNNTKLVQTSSGTGVSGGSDNGRGSPLLKGDFRGWLDRARVGSRR